MLLLTWLFNCAWLFPMPWATLSDYRAELEQNNLSASMDAGEPNQALKEHEIDEFIEFNTEKVWFSWGLNFLILAAGIFAAAMMFAGRRLWPLYVLCTSVLYLTFWVLKQN